MTQIISVQVNTGQITNGEIIPGGHDFLQIISLSFNVIGTYILIDLWLLNFMYQVYKYLGI